MEFSKTERNPLYELCRQHKAVKLYLFGSALTEKFDVEKSDLDFLVALLPMEPLETGEILMKLWSGLESLFQRRIDLLTERSVKDIFFIRRNHPD